MNVVVIAPHPDDESIGCGGALCRHADAGDRVTVAFLTSGELGLKQLAREAAWQIREAEAHDLAALVADLPNLRMIAFNGGKAGAIGRKQLSPLDGVSVVDLPSSSAGHSIGFASKLDRWRTLRDAL